MKKYIPLLLCILLLASCTGASEKRSRVLKVYNWADYIDEEVLAEFPAWYKEQTGEDGCCKRYVIEDNLNEIVWSVIRQLLAMTDAFKQKLDKQNNVSRQDNLILAEKLARLQQEKEKCESDRFVNVDQFMVGQLDKEMYQRRRADLGRLAEKLDADIAELEQKLKAAETMKDDSLSQALGVMKKYSGADELTQAMVQELIEKVVVMDLEHVEIVWKFKDEVRNFIGI